MTVEIDTVGRLMASADRRRLSATLIFDVTDNYASRVGVAGTFARALGPMRFSLIARDPGTGSEQPLEPPVALATITNPSGFQLWFGARGDGGLPPDPGSYRVRVDSDYYAPWTSPTLVATPAPSTPVRCGRAPGYAYPFARGGLAAASVSPTVVRGALQDLNGTGQAGASVAVTAGVTTMSYLTDVTGQFLFVIPDPPPATVSLTVAYPGGATAKLTGVPVTGGADSLVPQTVLSGSIVSSILGGTVALSRPATTVSAETDGSWRVVLPLDQKSARATVTATVAGRPTQKAQIQIKPGATTVVAPFVFA
jgi:hypothetical protein